MKNILEKLTREEFNLNNSFYCGYLIYKALEAQRKINDKGLECSVIYLILPMVMTKSITETLPATIRTSFYTWFMDNQWISINLADRINSYIDISNSALKLLLDFNVITLDGNGCFLLNPSVNLKEPTLFQSSIHVPLQVKATRFFSKWFSENSPASIYTVLGIKPQ
ncbi:TPA: hypothetical protein I9774_000754 [Serratia marcescens]|uniref:three component ABC system middle component n=1 Tax=Serratia TaxID=613 RepID=UPI001072CA85|nr:MULTISPECIES: three component ABC system middle component [Serratia]MBH2657717.1 hypothetical protein [Serratia ureilytica]MBH2700974.1 hypothetical protein [Serratia ureilytica]MBH2734371.1 hypothetical protein [Serratia ureilytica]MBH3076948.1 hypothetical protein [Serratia ureilytica]HAT5009889.1 hypothetical protein [Serratia marcescens]